MPSSFAKDPDAVLDYTVDWSAWLAGDTIVTATWVVPVGLTQTSASSTTTTATVWLSGGAAGTTYQVTSRVTTAGGRTDDRTITINVADR